jgi:predicted RNA-binding Zn-ribbon protein involved in translation (DUF1610 family)
MMARIQNDMVPSEKCGKCGSANITRVMRAKLDGKTYRGLQCQSCYAEMSLVAWEDKDGIKSVFPGRKDGMKRPLPNKGWKDPASNKYPDDETS